MFYSLFFITHQNNLNPLPDVNNKVMSIIISPVGVVTVDTNDATSLLTERETKSIFKI